MYKKLSLILIFSLLSVQFLSPLHMAEHGFDKHEHNGQLCDIYLHGKYQQHADDTAPATVAESITYAIISYATAEQLLAVSAFKKATLARAPPTLS